MESTRRSALRRRPLADCTNTTIAAARRNLSSPAAKTAGVAILKASKPSNSAATKPKPKPKNPSSSSSLKSNTSTGSNNPTNVDNLLSDPPAPPTPLSDSGGRDRRKIGPPAAQSRKDEKTSMDKEKMSSTTPIVQASKPPVRQALLRSSSPTTGPPAIHNKKQDAEERKDKGKMVLETPNIETAVLSGPHVPLSTSSASSGNCHLSGPPEAQNQKLDEQKAKDKGKMILESPIIEITDILRPHISLASSSAAGCWHLSGPPAQKSKDKEKMVLETPIIETTDIFRPHVSLASSSATSGNCHLLRPPAAQNKKLDPQERKDKGKKVLDSLSIAKTNSLRLHVPLTSSSAASGNSHISGPHAVEIQKFDVPKSKDKEKMVQETLDIEATDPSTPRASSSGTRDQERPIFLTVYNQRRASRRRKPADGMIMALSGPPKKRTKNLGVELDDDCGKKNSGSHTDPLPMHKKKQSRNKRDNDSASGMPQDEIERLRAYYAEIDDFELPVEVASESD